MLKWILESLVSVLGSFLLKDMMTLFLILDWWLEMINDLCIEGNLGWSFFSFFIFMVLMRVYISLWLLYLGVAFPL